MHYYLSSNKPTICKRNPPPRKIIPKRNSVWSIEVLVMLRLFTKKPALCCFTGSIISTEKYKKSALIRLHNKPRKVNFFLFIFSNFIVAELISYFAFGKPWRGQLINTTRVKKYTSFSPREHDGLQMVLPQDEHEHKEMYKLSLNHGKKKSAPTI